VRLRTRVTAVAGLALTVGVVLGLVLLFLLQRHSARSNIDAQLRTYAVQIEEAGAIGTWPRPLPASPLDATAQAQVLAPDGAVLSATRALLGSPAVYQLAPGSDVPVRQSAANGVLSGEVTVVATRAAVSGQPVTIVTMTTTDPLSQINETFARLLLIGVPGILVLASVTVWLVVGRALRPVERIRHAVTEITAADLSQRVPEPGIGDEVGNLAHTMNDMLARLDDSAYRQRRFVADASHELRSPLAAIRTTLEVGLAHPEAAPWPDIAGRAVRQTERLESLIQQLLLLARADDRQLTARRERVDLAALVREVATATAASGASVDVTAPPAAVTVTGDAEHLSRLFRNIIDNAVRYARHQVHVTIAGQDAAVQVEVSDDGPGIPAAERERVFDRFVRLDPSRERASGSAGLGLAIAREIATVHGGRITITESPSGGARVTTILPRG
jgi:signal transduction histidine kinase